MSLLFGNAYYFSYFKLSKFCLDKGINLCYASNYYSQGNMVAKSTNKDLIQILKKIIVNHQNNWHDTLPKYL